MTSKRASIAGATAALRRRIGGVFGSRDRRDDYLVGRRGVIHVGANAGQERKVYAALGLPVLWIEPIPAVFTLLQHNIAPYPLQRAVQALVTSRDGEEMTLNVASNGGASSSILALAAHKDIWPDVSYVGSLKLLSKTLPAVLAAAGIDPSGYDVLVIDTQGSELSVLEGARALLAGFTHIKTEAADFEAYAGCARVTEIETFMSVAGFKTLRKDKFASHAQGGAYYDLLFDRRS